MLGRWLEQGERDLGVVGESYLQGVLLSEVSAARLAVATERRIVMLDGAELDRHGRVGQGRVCFHVAWTSVHGMWTGVMPFPPEMWRQGPEGEVVVFTLAPAAAGGQDVVICSNIETWLSAGRAMGVAEIRD